MTHICWNPDDVQKYVGAAVAEAIDNQSAEEFFDRHVPMTLHGARSGGAVVHDRQYSEGDFLREFLAAGKGRTSVLGAVIGESGHGKTHYLLWVEQMLRQQGEEHRQILRIPRIKTSLPGIIEELIDAVPEAERSEFHDIDAKLRQYGNDNVTDATLRLELKNALTVRLCREENKEHFADAKEFGKLARKAADYVGRGKMLDLLSIKVIQDWLISENGVIGRLVRSSIRPDGAESPLEQAVRFEGSQIPAAKWGQALEDQPAEKRLWTPFRSHPDEFAELLNWALEHAVKDFMATRFSVHNPEETIVQIRRAIHRANPDASLVLLIEDLANARYAEADLLNACTWEEDGLVPMRTLFATTTALFKDLRLSVQQRISPTSTELPLIAFAGKAWSVNGRPELDFASKYLPVFRRSEDGEGQCSICNDESSREAFGSHGDVGLYPFSVPVLTKLAQDVKKEKGAFHPRTFLRFLVAQLRDAAGRLRAGQFPGEGLEVEADPRNREQIESLEKAMRSRNASQNEVRRAKRIANAYGRVDGPRGFRVYPLVWERFQLGAPGGADPDPVLPPGDLARAQSELAGCKSLAEIDTWKQGLSTSEWSNADWQVLLDASQERRSQFGGESPPPPPPPEDGINKWVDGAVLLETDDEKLKRAVESQFVDGIDWAILGIAPTFRETLVKGASNFVVAGSVVQDGDGMHALHVKVGVPEDPHGGISERKPYLWLHEMRLSSENNKEAVGLPSGSAVKTADDYAKLADAQDYVQDEIQSQVRSVWGGVDEQVGWLLRSLIEELASSDDVGLRALPENVCVPDVLEWLRQLQGAGACADKVKRLLLHLSSWKLKGAPFFADAYCVVPVMHALEGVCEAVTEPEAVKEATGSDLLKRMRLQAPKVAERITARRQAGQKVRIETLADLKLLVAGDGDVDRASLQALAKKASSVAEDMLQIVPDGGFREHVAGLRAVTVDCLQWLRRSDDAFADWSQTVRLDRRFEAENLHDSLRLIAEGTRKRAEAVEQQGRSVPDVQGAKKQAAKAIQELRSAIQGNEEGL